MPKKKKPTKKLIKPIGHTRKELDKLIGYKIDDATWKGLKKNYAQALDKYECGGKARICLYDESQPNEHACNREMADDGGCCDDTSSKKVTCPDCIKVKTARKNKK